MSGWETLVSAALVGTQRSAVDLDALPEPVRELLAKVDSDLATDPARRLLTAAAAMTAYRRAGVLPLPVVATGAPVPEDDRPLVSASAARRLSRLVAGEQAELLPEWLIAVADRGLRVPPEHLPALADAGKARSVLRPLIAKAAGPRGPWLAALSSNWAYLAEHPTANGQDTDVWRFGSAVARREWLAALRRASPTQAREALVEVWRREPANIRVDFLTVFRDGLQLADEEFLESVLDDRARDVRRLAAELLANLPGSRLSQRMADRAAAMVEFERRTIRGDQLVLSLPVECDERMRRDGIDPTPPPGTGERAWWFRQILAATPLAFWSDFVPGPEEVLRLPVSGAGGALALHAALADAAARQRDPRWARALLTVPAADIAVEQVAGLVMALPCEEWAEAVSAQLARKPVAQLADVFLGLPTPWPADLGNLMLDRLDDDAGEHAIGYIAHQVARAVPTDCLDHPLVCRPPREGASPWHHRLVEILLFRRAMYEELS